MPGTFQAIRGHFREHVSSGQATLLSCRRLRQQALAQTDRFTPLQLSLQSFGLIVNLWCKLALKERVTTNETNPNPNPGVKKVMEEAVKMLQECFPYLALSPPFFRRSFSFVISF